MLAFLRYGICTFGHTFEKSLSVAKFCALVPNEEHWKTSLHNTMKIFPDFISPDEERTLLEEVDPYMKRLRYEFSHWDDAIHGYRETERLKWNEQNELIIQKIRNKAFQPGLSQLAFVHVLDLAEGGWIKPHVDSIRFCGDIIAGLSLLSNCVMRLTMVGHESERIQDFLLPQRSLYIMSGSARSDYKHEILKDDDSYFNGEKVPRKRRISIICRSMPHPRSKE